MSEGSPAIGVIGVGMMGEGMASRLIAAGRRVAIVAHKNRDPVERLVARGASVHDDAADLVRACDVVLTCLPDAEVLQSVVDRAEAALSDGTLWIDASTGHPEITRAVAGRIEAAGARFADAPVTGGPAQAESGDLASLVGCDEGDLADVEAVVGAYSRVVRRMGPVGAGHTAKLLNNFVTQGTMVLLGQAFRMAGAQGVDWRALHEAMNAGAGRSGTLEKAVAPALGGDFDGSRFTLRNAEKDLRYAADLFPDRESAAARALHAQLAAYVEAGHGERFVSRQLQIDPFEPG